MAVRKYTFFAVLALLSLPARAEPYVFLGLGSMSLDAPAPVPSAITYTPTSTSTGENDHSVGLLHVGYRWDAGWYAQGGLSYLGGHVKLLTRRGTEAGNDRLTHDRTEIDFDAIELKVGRVFALSNTLGVFAEVGAHRYSLETNTEIIDRTTDPSGNVLSETTTKTASTTERDTAAVYGAGIVLFPGANSSLRIGAARYEDVDNTVAYVAATIGF